MSRLSGSIPHLPGSRVAADRTVTATQARRCLDPLAARASEAVVVQEKLDGSCVAVVRNARGEIEARGREGALAAESRNDARRMFAVWVDDHRARLEAVVREGETLVGEWLALVHGTRYELAHEPFVAFDLLRPDRQRVTVDVLAARLAPSGLTMPGIVHRGGPLGIDAACTLLGERGLHGAIDPPEGLVYRVERGGEVVLIAKWVRPTKIDGCLLPENTGREALYHWRPR
ncbi:RNA ligase family protein [soil metagenome]